MLEKLLDIYLKLSGTLIFLIICISGVIWYHIKRIINFICRKKVLDLQNSHSYIKFIVNSYFYGLGIDIKVKYLDSKLPKDKNVIYLYSHASTIEPMVMYSSLSIFPKSLAKIQLFKTTLVKDVLNFTGSIPVDSSNLSDTLNILKGVEKELTKGTYISLAPEGKRRTSRSIGKGEQLLEFKKGAFRMAKNVKCSIIPIIFYGAGRIMPSGSYFPIPRSTVYLEVLPEISSEEIEKYDHNELREKVRNDMIKIYKNYPDSKIFNGGLGVKYNFMILSVFLFIFFLFKNFFNLLCN